MNTFTDPVIPKNVHTYRHLMAHAMSKNNDTIDLIVSTSVNLDERAVPNKPFFVYTLKNIYMLADSRDNKIVQSVPRDPNLGI